MARFVVNIGGAPEEIEGYAWQTQWPFVLACAIKNPSSTLTDNAVLVASDLLTRPAVDPAANVWLEGAGVHALSAELEINDISQVLIDGTVATNVARPSDISVDHQWAIDYENVSDYTVLFFRAPPRARIAISITSFQADNDTLIATPSLSYALYGLPPAATEITAAADAASQEMAVSLPIGSPAVIARDDEVVAWLDLAETQTTEHGIKFSLDTRSAFRNAAFTSDGTIVVGTTILEVARLLLQEAYGPAATVTATSAAVGSAGVMATAFSAGDDPLKLLEDILLQFSRFVRKTGETAFSLRALPDPNSQVDPALSTITATSAPISATITPRPHTVTVGDFSVSVPEAERGRADFEETFETRYIPNIGLFGNTLLSHLRLFEATAETATGAIASLLPGEAIVVTIAGQRRNAYVTELQVVDTDAFPFKIKLRWRL